jgi:hypothetical protein
MESHRSAVYIIFNNARMCKCKANFGYGASFWTKKMVSSVAKEEVLRYIFKPFSSTVLLIKMW